MRSRGVHIFSIDIRYASTADGLPNEVLDRKQTQLRYIIAERIRIPHLSIIASSSCDDRLFDVLYVVRAKDRETILILQIETDQV